MTSNVRALERAASRADGIHSARSEVEDAFRTILRWTGDDAEREGLLETPARAVRAMEEFFSGYAQNPAELLKKTFSETAGYDEMVVLRGVRFDSHCEHHISPIFCKAWVAYVPSGRVVGISKLARVVSRSSRNVCRHKKS